MKWTAADYRYMARALQLAQKGLYSTRPNPRVGCVLVRDDQVIAEGWHEVAGGPHAEIRALEAAGGSAADATCYVSLEPCNHQGRTGPCTEAVIKAGIGRVVAAMIDPNPDTAGSGLGKLSDAGIETGCGLLETQARELNKGFIRRMTAGRPHVRCKLAMSLDGRTAMAGGESQWITSDAARRDVQHWRARSCAIMTGIGTVLADDPGMNVRDIRLEHGGPLRVVIDRQLRFPPKARMLDQPGRILILTCENDAGKTAVLEKAGAELRVLKNENFLLQALQYLAHDEKINEVLVESGASLAGALLEQQLLDELIVYQAPIIMGHAARGLFHLPLLQKMEDRIALDLTDMRRVGSDIRLTLNVCYGNTQSDR